MKLLICVISKDSSPKLNFEQLDHLELQIQYFYYSTCFNTRYFDAMEYAKSVEEIDYVLMIPNEPRILEGIQALLKNMGEYDLILGSRGIRDSICYSGMKRRLHIQAMSLTFSSLFREIYHDWFCPVRLIHVSLLPFLGNNLVLDVAKAISLNASIIEVPSFCSSTILISFIEFLELFPKLLGYKRRSNQLEVESFWS